MASLELEARLDNLLATAQEETADIDIFAPIPEKEECPICLIRLPLRNEEVVFKPCCGNVICMGCIYKHLITDARKGESEIAEHKCAFCRQQTLSGQRRIKAMKKLMKNNNPDVYLQMAFKYKFGEDGVIQSDTRTLEMRIRAAELGNANAFAGIGLCYREGTALEEDMSKSIEFYEVGAKKGSLTAHRYLSWFHHKNGNLDMGYGHVRVLASAGCKESMDLLMKVYKNELLSKEDLAQTLRAFQASRDEMNSKDRDNARLLEEARQKGEAPPAHLLWDT